MIGQMSLFTPDKTLKLRNRVELVKVTTQDARYILEEFHYLHRTRVGRQVNYAVMIDGECDGVITYAYPMISHPLAGVPPDEMVEFARLYLHKNVPHSATCAIGKSLRRIKQDWKLYFPDAKPIRMVVSWSDSVLHKGIIYRAANFVWLRNTKDSVHGSKHGNSEQSRRGTRAKHSDYGHYKDCWVYWL